MLAANYDITLDRAADYSFVLTINNQAGAAVDLSAANNAGSVPTAFIADVREVATKKEVLDLTPTVLGTATNGQVLISITKAQTKTLKAGSGIYEWDLFMDRGNPIVRTRLLYGALTARAQNTNDA
jgi:hypothetical protein